MNILKKYSRIRMNDMTDGMVVVGLATMFGLALVLVMIFMTAYMSPAKAVRVNIDNYGEAQLEFWLLLALLPINAISTIVAAKRFSENSRDRISEKSL